MIRRYLWLLVLIVAAIAVAGIFALMHKGGPSMHGAAAKPAAGPVAAPAQSPYPTFVAGAGIVEASTENIAIGTPVAGIVASIDVTVGSRVRKGDPLFSLDSRAVRAELQVRLTAVKVAAVQLANAKNELARAQRLADSHAISSEERDARHYAFALAEAQLETARANVLSTETDLERMTVRAPVEGEILQLKIRLGEFAPAGPTAQPLILLGGVEPMNVRVDVDENDAWRVRPGAPAVAFLKGNKDIMTTLEFVRVEPYVVPKRSLTGESTERVDTRVLQAVYRFERGDLPIYVGQQMNVFIKAGGPERRGQGRAARAAPG